MVENLVNMNNIDFLVDYFVGQEGSLQSRRQREETKDNLEAFTKKLDFKDFFMLHCQHLHALRASFSKKFR